MPIRLTAVVQRALKFEVPIYSAHSEEVEVSFSAVIAIGYYPSFVTSATSAELAGEVGPLRL